MHVCPQTLLRQKVASNAYGAPYAKTRNSVCVSDRRETPVLHQAKLGFLDGLSRALVRSAFLIPVSDSNPIKCPMLGMGRPPADKTGGNHTICPRANRPSSPSPAPIAQCHFGGLPIEPRCHFAATGGHRPPLGSPFGGAGERSASLRGRVQLQVCALVRDSRRVPSQSRLAAVPALP